MNKNGVLGVIIEGPGVFSFVRRAPRLTGLTSLTGRTFFNAKPARLERALKSRTAAGERCEAAPGRRNSGPLLTHKV